MDNTFKFGIDKREVRIHRMTYDSERQQVFELSDLRVIDENFMRSFARDFKGWGEKKVWNVQNFSPILCVKQDKKDDDLWFDYLQNWNNDCLRIWLVSDYVIPHQEEKEYVGSESLWVLKMDVDLSLSIISQLEEIFKDIWWNNKARNI